MKALILSGGGSKGSFEVGALKHLLVDEKNEYDLIAGVSVGAINAAIICQHPKGTDPKIIWEDLKSVWDNVKTSKIRKSWFLFGKLWSIFKPSVYNTRPLHDWIRQSLDTNKVLQSGRKLRIVAVSWDSGESQTATETTADLASWVLASSAFPVMFGPISINGQQWTDGGVRNVTPLGEAIRAGATEIDVVMASNPDIVSPFNSKKKSAVPDLVFRAVDLMSNQIMRSDLKICGLKNDLAGPYKQVKLRIIQPSIDLENIQDSLDFEQPGIQKLIEIGYEEALKS